MTLPIERTNAVLNVEQFLMDLRDPKKYPRVPKAVREEAHRLLRHYPSKYNMAYIADSFEEVDYSTKPSGTDWRLLAELAEECDTVDPIDWGELNISEKEAFRLMAMHVAEMDNDHLTLKAICVKLMVENFVLNLKLLGKR